MYKLRKRKLSKRSKPSPPPRPPKDKLFKWYAMKRPAVRREPNQICSVSRVMFAVALLSVAQATKMVDHMQSPGVTFGIQKQGVSYQPYTTTSYNADDFPTAFEDMLDNNLETFCDSGIELGELGADSYLFVQFPEPVQIGSIYMLNQPYLDCEFRYDQESYDDCSYYYDYDYYYGDYSFVPGTTAFYEEDKNECNECTASFPADCFPLCIPEFQHSCDVQCSPNCDTRCPLVKYQDQYLANIYAGSSPDWRQNTLCQAFFAGEGIVSCNNITAEYIHIVPANLGLSPTYQYDANDGRLMLSEMKVFTETEVGGNQVTEITHSAGGNWWFDHDYNFSFSDFADLDPLPQQFIGNTEPDYIGRFLGMQSPSGNPQVNYELEGAFGINSVIVAAPYNIVNELHYTYALYSSQTIQVNVFNSQTSQTTTCDSDTNILWKNVLEFDCLGNSGDQIQITEVSGLSSLTLRKVAIFDKVVSFKCAPEPISIPNMTAYVAGEPITYELLTSESCSKATYSFKETYDWLKLSAGTDQHTIQIAPDDNSQQGTHVLTLLVTYDSDPSMEPIESIFQVTILSASNQAPSFGNQELSVFQQVYKVLEPDQTWSYTIPEPYDPDGNRITLTVDTKLANFIQFDQQSNRIIIPDLSSPDVLEGQHKVEIKLDDGTNIQIFEVTLQIHSPFLPENKDEDISEQDSSELQQEDKQAEEDTKELQKPENLPKSTEVFDWKDAFAELERQKKDEVEELGEVYVPSEQPLATMGTISDSGMVEISFSQDIKEFESLKAIEDTLQLNNNGRPVFSLQVIAGEYSIKDKLGFSWSVKGMTKRTLSLQLIFENPIYISAEEDPEILQIEISDGSIFLSEDGLPLQLSNNQDQSRSQEEEIGKLVLQKEIPKQKSVTNADLVAMEALKNTAQGSKWIWLLNFALSASLQHLWSMINTQQLIVMLPLCRVILPTNAATFFEQIFKIAAFDFFSTSDLVNDTLQLAPTGPKNDNFNQLGFQSKYVINNMGTMVFIFLIYPILFMIQAIMQRFKDLNSCCKKANARLKRHLYYQSIITITFESYALIALCCFIAIPLINFNSYGETIQSLACICLLLAILILPCIAIRYSAKHFGLLNTRTIRGRFGAIYDDLKLRNGPRVLYQPTFFLMRRILFALTVVIIEETLISQLILIFLQSFAAYYILQFANPFQSETQRKIEIFNESILLMVTYTIVCLSAWIASIETKFMIGYVSAGLVCIHIVVNLSIITYTTIKTYIKKCRLQMATKNHNQERIMLKETLKNSHDKRIQRIRVKSPEQSMESYNSHVDCPEWLISFGDAQVQDELFDDTTNLACAIANSLMPVIEQESISNAVPQLLLRPGPGQRQPSPTRDNTKDSSEILGLTTLGTAQATQMIKNSANQIAPTSQLINSGSENQQKMFKSNDALSGDIRESKIRMPMKIQQDGEVDYEAIDHNTSSVLEKTKGLQKIVSPTSNKDLEFTFDTPKIECENSSEESSEDSSEDESDGASDEGVSDGASDNASDKGVSEGESAERFEQLMNNLDLKSIKEQELRDNFWLNSYSDKQSSSLEPSNLVSQRSQKEEIKQDDPSRISETEKVNE